MDMRRMKPKQKPKIPPLDKKIKPNPKYENVKPTIDTGNNTRKQVERMEEIRQYYKFRPDEIFRRITVTSLVTLMLEVSKLEYQEEDAERLTNQIREDQESLQQTSKAEATPAPPQEASMEPQEMVQEAAKEEEEVDDSCEADSLDSAIDPEEHTRQLEDDQDDGYIDSIVFKGKKIRKGGGLHSHHFSSVGNLLQGIGEIELSPRAINDMSDRNYHHHDSSKAASTFQLDALVQPSVAQDKPHCVHHFEVISTNEVVTAQQQPLIEESKLRKRDRPYLILDIRDVDQYKQGRIVTSKSYPAVRLSRSVNYESRDMIKFKNAPGKLIIVADADESLAAKFATVLIQRGYDNVFVLSGGLRVARIKFPEQLITPLVDFDVDDQDDLDEAFGEDQIHVIEAFLEEALTSGTSRLSSLAPSSSARNNPGPGWPSRISSSQSNLPSLMSNNEPSVRHKARQVPLGGNYYPPRPQRTSFNSRRS